MNSNLVAIVIPVYKPRKSLDATEVISYMRLWELYGNANIPIILMASSGLDVSDYIAERPALKIESFDFKTTREYSQLLLQPHFYERFVNYKFILIYQLDAYFLRDELEEWCDKGYDYVGAPIFYDYEPSEPEGKIWCVGNGGFSLRNVESSLKVLASRKHYLAPSQYWAQNKTPSGIFKKITWAFSGLLRFTGIHNDVRWATLSNFHEDIFWAVEAPHFWPSFRLPDVQTGLKFAFDYAPAYCYELAGRKLPFGCHAWQRYDLTFWRQFIPETANLPHS